MKSKSIPSKNAIHIFSPSAKTYTQKHNEANVPGYKEMKRRQLESENKMTKETLKLVGVDEAGRGPLAGPVVAGAVYLKHDVPGLADSKAITPRKREQLFQVITQEHVWAYAVVSSREIDQLNILSTSCRIMPEVGSRFKRTFEIIVAVINSFKDLLLIHLIVLKISSAVI